ncbi:hypothetical protein NEMIN01_0134 [Nematocida minor]|uniref:uncharacterized protein n=1 Tax=Nematocida minor TaxID=1912983 RepID=UPI002220DF40|nr:uncharacterized protein NEMIN01_0030 [Nematocida minor]XP_051332036.1 uncharacterized protein NEMIN01_0134 [Nematocida minor]KAI5188766.1 hypothetical protein NEMIN01_0030 [Nematocida minor]KAI5188870.1 hypothetical protein NEMIN01_0134 [Nematocida minor]
MGFLLSKLYRDQSVFILVLRLGSEKKYAIVEDFFSVFLSKFKIVYTHRSEYLTYNKISEKNRSLSIVEMHDRDHCNLFWDCITGMHSIVYFIESLTSGNMLEVIGQIKVIKDANAGASVLLVIVSNKMEMEGYVQFRKSLKQALDGVSYRVVDGVINAPEKTLLTKDEICQGFSWILNQTS